MAHIIGEGGGNLGGIIIVFFIIIIVIALIILILLIFDLTKLLTQWIGKHACRYVSLIFKILAQLGICLICFLSKTGEILYIIGGISSFLGLINFLEYYFLI